MEWKPADFGRLLLVQGLYDERGLVDREFGGVGVGGVAFSIVEEDSLGHAFFSGHRGQFGEVEAARTRIVVVMVGIVQAADHNALLDAGGMQEFALPDVDAYMGDAGLIGVLEEDQITGLQICRRDRSARRELGLRRSRDVDAPLGADGLDEAGAVEAGLRRSAAETVGSAAVGQRGLGKRLAPSRVATQEGGLGIGSGFGRLFGSRRGLRRRFGGGGNGLGLSLFAERRVTCRSISVDEGGRSYEQTDRRKTVRGVGSYEVQMGSSFACIFTFLSHRLE
jgi:hypothetical protein